MDQGLEILAFPCNQFLFQEPGTNAEIKARILRKFSPKFRLFSKIDVNGPGTHDVYKFLRSAELENQAEGSKIEWNFAKFIVGRNGQVLKRFSPKVDPQTFDVEDALPLWLSARS